MPETSCSDRSRPDIRPEMGGSGARKKGTLGGTPLVSCPRNKHIFRCDQNGPPARREEGAYPERYATDEQRGRRPIFIATLWAAASWLFFRVARSSRIDLDMLVARALKNSQLTCGERHAYFGDRTLVPCPRNKHIGDKPLGIRRRKDPILTYE